MAELNALRAAVSHFEGTHNFHNFTVDKDFRDRSNQRHMKSIQVADPVVHGETEWISVLLHGQSFMLHQVFTPPELNRPGVSHLTPKDRAYGFVSFPLHGGATLTSRERPFHLAQDDGGSRALSTNRNTTQRD